MSDRYQDEHAPQPPASRPLTDAERCQLVRENLAKWKKPEPNRMLASALIRDRDHWKERAELAEADCLEQARLNGMGSEREARLMAERDSARKDARINQEKFEVARQALQQAEARVSELTAKLQDTTEGEAWEKGHRQLAEARVAELTALVRTMWIHSGYPDCGRDQMTTPQKALYDSIAHPAEQPAPRGEAWTEKDEQ